MTLKSTGTITHISSCCHHRTLPWRAVIGNLYRAFFRPKERVDKTFPWSLDKGLFRSSGSGQLGHRVIHEQLLGGESRFGHLLVTSNGDLMKGKKSIRLFIIDNSILLNGLEFLFRGAKNKDAK